jgi:D-alanyl-D-alanine carboxypeptidase
MNGAAAEVRVGECVWQGAAGIADVVANTPVEPDDLFRVGSITKSFVASVVVMLHLEGSLTLDDPIADYVSGIPNGENITIRQVLNHTSGLFPYLSGGLPFDCTQQWAPADIVAFATAQPPSFSPGDSWQYCNTGYIIAGMTVEAATANDLASEIRSRILEPLGLQSTYLDGAEPAVPGLVRGYSGPSTIWSGCGDNDVTDFCDPSFAWAAGALVSTSADLNTFYDALLSGQLLDAQGLAEMQTFVPTGQGFDYGLGLLQVPDRPLGSPVGHTGEIPGFTAVSFHYAETDTDVTLNVNCTSSGAHLFALFDALEQPLLAAR